MKIENEMRHCALAIAIMLLLCSCSNADKAVPRREGFPRIERYDQTMAPADSVPVDFLVNVNAKSMVKSLPGGAVWLSISYPIYDAEILCTFTPATIDEVENVIDNRTERIHLNLGGATPAFKEYMSTGGYHSTVAIAPSAMATPVQFISVNEENPQWVVSGAIYFPNSGRIASIDSVAPIVEAMEQDLTIALKEMK